MNNDGFVETIQRLCETSVDTSKPSGEMIISWLVASSTCRFSTLHCYQFDVNESAFPLEIAGAGFSAPWCDDRGFAVRYRTRSFIDGNLRLGRTRDPLIAGEIRELSVLVYSGNPCSNASGNLNILFAYGETTEVYSPNTLDENGFLFGLNFLPLVLAGTSPDRLDQRGFHLWGSHALYMSTARVQCETKESIASKDMRGLHSNTLAEYLTGAREDLSVFSRVHNFEMFDGQLQKIRARCALKLKSLMNPKKTSKDDIIVRVNMAIDTAFSVNECTTLGAFLDMTASGVFMGVTVLFMSNPTVAPLYICVCVLIAGNPGLVDGNSCVSGSPADRIYRSFLNLVPENDSETGTAIEIAILMAVDGLKKSLQENNYSPQLNKGHLACIEHMKRQGVALCLELTGNAPPNVDYYRVSSRDARHQALLRIMTDVNSWLTSAVWREQVITAEASSKDAVGVNQQCFDWARIKIAHFFTCGIYATTDHTAIVIPAAPAHRNTACSKCGNDFLTNTIMTQTTSTLGCSRCHALFCRACCDHAIAKISDGPIDGPIGRVIDVVDADAWLCKLCISDCKHTATEKKKKKKSEKGQKGEKGEKGAKKKNSDHSSKSKS